MWQYEFVAYSTINCYIICDQAILFWFIFSQQGDNVTSIHAYTSQFVPLPGKGDAALWPLGHLNKLECPELLDNWITMLYSYPVGKLNCWLSARKT